MKTELKPGERLDDLQIKGYKIIQKPGQFCFSVDAVLLANHASVRKGERALDLGCGTGVVPLLLEAKNEGGPYVGLEIQEECAGLARRSVAYNGLEDKIEIVTGDIREASALFGMASFSVITANPPYMTADQGKQNTNEAQNIARREVLGTLDDLLRESAKLLKTGGRFYMIHRPSRLPEILAKMSAAHLEPKRMRLVHPYADREANLVLLTGVKGGKPQLKVEAPLVVYGEDGNYTEEMKGIYGEGKTRPQLLPF